MISRIYVTPRGKDSRAGLYKKSWTELGLTGKIKDICIADSYLIDFDVPHQDVEKIARVLSNETLEKFSINELPTNASDFSYAIEISFLPGVTDNVSHTARETITNFFHLKDNSNLAVYTSKVFLISGNVMSSDLKEIALSLYNPLIEHAFITNLRTSGGNLPLLVPKVVLPKTTSVIKVSLAVPDEELIKIGKEGIMDENDSRRGPLALDLESMKVIQNYFAKLKRD